MSENACNHCGLLPRIPGLLHCKVHSKLERPQRPQVNKRIVCSECKRPRTRYADGKCYRCWEKGIR